MGRPYGGRRRPPHEKPLFHGTYGCFTQFSTTGTEKYACIAKLVRFQGAFKVLARYTRVCCKKYIAKSNEAQAE
jgi:hypothetical protein